MKWHFISVPRVPKNPESQSNNEKNIRKILIQGHPTKYLTSTPQTVKVIKNKIKNNLTIVIGEWGGDSGERGFQELL